MPGLRLDGSVRDALAHNGPVVALETSVLAQGLPETYAREAATRMNTAVRRAGAEPAWIWVEDGAIRVGGGEQDLARLMTADAIKVARRDVPMAVTEGRLGATTVSATLWAAARTGIEIAATGGIGGVHPGSRDVSADLVTLAGTGGMLVCSGPKSIIDAEATLERLEELGIGLVGYRTDRLPHFLVRQTSLPLEHRADTAEALAAVLHAGRTLGMSSTVLACNPIPEDAALDASTVDEAVTESLARAEAAAVSGKELTPFLLGCLAELTGGDSLRANVELLEANAALGAEVATELARMRSHGTVI